MLAVENGLLQAMRRLRWRGQVLAAVGQGGGLCDAAGSAGSA